MTGQSILNYLSKKYNEIYLIEDWEENPSLREIDRFGIKVHVNPQINSELFSKISDVYSSPGIPIQHKALSLASKHKINIFSDIEEFLKINKSIKILITGTNGKTSTCQILETLLRSVFSDLKIVSVGNIGKPVLNYIDNDIDVSIIEVSSFQLELLNEVEFDIGLLLNIEEDHLDKHADIEDYRNVKNSVLKKADINISYNDRNLFSKTFLNYKTIILPNELAESSIFNNWPSHDIENLKACVAVLEAFIERFRKSSIGNINLFAELEKAFDQFKKFPHRFEHLEMVGGVNFINDSKATNLDAMLKAISAANELDNHLKKVDGVMLGRKVYSDPSFLLSIDKNLYGKDTFCSIDNALKEYMNYILNLDNRKDSNRAINHLMQFIKSLSIEKNKRKEILEKLNNKNEELNSIFNDFTQGCQRNLSPNL